MLALGACDDDRGPPAPGARFGPAVGAARCVDPANGAVTSVALDAARGLADGQPATFGARRISWRNPADGGTYELDRTSGALTITRPSSTGGYMSFYACAAEPGRAR